MGDAELVADLVGAVVVLHQRETAREQRPLLHELVVADLGGQRGRGLGGEERHRREVRPVVHPRGNGRVDGVAERAVLGDARARLLHGEKTGGGGAGAQDAVVERGVGEERGGQRTAGNDVAERLLGNGLVDALAVEDDGDDEAALHQPELGLRRPADGPARRTLPRTRRCAL